MEDESIKTPEQSGDTPVDPTTSSVKRKSPVMLVVIAFVFVLVLIVLGFFLMRTNTKTPVNTPKTTSVPPVSGTELREVQSEASGYISSQRLADGYYNYYSHLDQLCIGKDAETCQFTPTENKKYLSVGWTALAHFADYKVSNIAAHLTEANKDLYKLIETCKKTTSNCNAVLVQAAIIYKETKDPKVLQFITEESNEIVSLKLSDDLMIRGIETRELALAYEITKNPRFLSAAKTRLASSQELLSKKMNEDLAPKKRFQREACWVSLAQIELGRVENNTQDIINAVSFLDQYKLLENTDSLFNPIVFQPCIESYYNAGSALKSDANVLYASKLLDVFLANYLDSKSDKILFGEGGTATFPRSVDNNILANSIALPDSAYSNYLLYLKTSSTK